LPYAGGSSAVYRQWPDLLPDDVELLAVQLPGRGGRFREELATDLVALVRNLAEDVVSFTDKPYVVFGHSMGALLAFELCRRLRSLGAAPPLGLVVAGSLGPRRRAAARTTTHTLPDDELIALLRRWRASPPEVLANAEYMRLALPMLRSDFRICETYRYEDEPPLEVPLIVLGGTDDRLAVPVHLDEWRLETTGPVTVELVAGGHFFVTSARQAVIDLILSKAFGAHEGQRPRRG
jgi:medium-chain acyl-[acyl-carrier-protein] hydrolase